MSRARPGEGAEPCFCALCAGARLIAGHGLSGDEGRAPESIPLLLARATCDFVRDRERHKRADRLEREAKRGPRVEITAPATPAGVKAAAILTKSIVEHAAGLPAPEPDPAPKKRHPWNAKRKKRLRAVSDETLNDQPAEAGEKE